MTARYYTSTMQRLDNISDEIDLDWIIIKNSSDILDFLLFGISFPTILANILVIWASRVLYEKNYEPTHILIRSLTVADLLTCSMHLLRVVLTHFVIVPYPKVLTIQMALTWISYSASGFSLCLINLEKIAYFYWPLHYNIIITANTTAAAVVCCWLMCIGYAAVMLSSAHNRCGTDHCIVSDPDVYRFYVILFCIVPVLSSGLLSIRLWFTVRKKRKMSYGACISLRQHLKTMAFIFCTSAWVVISLVPARIHYMFFLEENNMIVVWFGFIGNYLLLLSPMVNPMITIFVYACYRRLVTKWYKRIETFFKHAETPASYRNRL